MSLSEGASDYLTATLVDDARSGQGFVLATPNEPIRDLDPGGREYIYPRDVDRGDPHNTGMIFGGALWDLRKALIARDGYAAGVATVDDYYYATLRRASDLLTSYVEVLAADDDDGDLANGTPNQCAIDGAFGRHGLVDAADLGVTSAAIVRDGFTLTFTPVALHPCAETAVTRVTMYWRIRGGPTTNLELVRSGGSYVGVIPTQPDGTIVEHALEVLVATGITYPLPANEGDAFAQFYVGSTIPLYCTDFEGDPFAAGWSRAGTGQDWQWGPPRGGVDPAAAWSGTRVVGEKLDGNGLHVDFGGQTSLTSPRIDTRGKLGVRLQYRRWLTIADGHDAQARAVADGATLWTNLRTTANTTETIDREWRFVDHNIDAAAADGSVRVSFEREGGGLRLGGWTLDDFCVVAQATGARCGDGQADAPEGCDDGNLIDGDTCSASCTVEPVTPDGGDDDGGDDDGGDAGCCSTGASPHGALGLGLGAALLLGRRRRRSLT